MAGKGKGGKSEKPYVDGAPLDNTSSTYVVVALSDSARGGINHVNVAVRRDKELTHCAAIHSA